MLVVSTGTNPEVRPSTRSSDLRLEGRPSTRSSKHLRLDAIHRTAGELQLEARPHLRLEARSSTRSSTPSSTFDSKLPPSTRSSHLRLEAPVHLQVECPRSFLLCFFHSLALHDCYHGCCCCCCYYSWSCHRGSIEGVLKIAH
jgi:hypothetical protein